ncbi:hypothetical protein [Nocardia alba]|uniref:Uncharacterized protein n=1 Tax=Nocardia alba TaxID=225051 RepID=A0A4R1F6Y5_9NOCA|nr:hypothetical protein [Nocardia alba]TCJ89743.1 hypothetical protein DFR71_6380 [Nocardia alba]
MDDLELLLGAEFTMSPTAQMDCLTQQLMVAVESCTRNGIPFPRIWEEVEDALDLVPADIPAQWRSDLRLYLSDHVFSAFMKVPADTKPLPGM